MQRHPFLGPAAVCALLLCPAATTAQMSTPDGVVSAGGSANAPTFSLSWSLGQVSGKTFSGGGQITAGVQQPEGVLLRLNIKVLLDGPYVSASGLMDDGLRTGGLIPLVEPYSALAAFDHVGSGGGESTTSTVLATSGNNAIVDWVFVDLRRQVNNAVVVTSRSALLQRDGDIVDLDGVSPLRMNAVPGNYHVAVRHRNHLGVMTFFAGPLSPNPTAIDLTTGGTPTYGVDAQRIVVSARTLWAGEVVDDGQVRYTGLLNDRDPILVAIGGSLPNNTIIGYQQEDVTLDGVVKYTGLNNDRDPILLTIGGTLPTNIRTEQLP